MVTNAELRHRRKQVLANMLEKMTDLPIEEVLAVFSVRQNVSMRKSREYLEELRLLRVKALDHRMGMRESVE